MNDKKIEAIIRAEERRQNAGIELIASENYPAIDKNSTQGSILTAK